MNFTGNDLKMDVRELSGGEAIRLVLCQLFLSRYNVLVLDEPTNFFKRDTFISLIQLAITLNETKVEKAQEQTK